MGGDNLVAARNGSLEQRVGDNLVAARNGSLEQRVGDNLVGDALTDILNQTLEPELEPKP